MRYIFALLVASSSALVDIGFRKKDHQPWTDDIFRALIQTPNWQVRSPSKPDRGPPGQHPSQKGTNQVKGVGIQAVGHDHVPIRWSEPASLHKAPGLEDKPPLNLILKEHSATFADTATQNWTDGSRASSAFRNVLLIVHCRFQANDMEHVVCREREQIFRKYAPFFGDVFYMTRANGCAGMPDDPHVCVADVMKTRGADRDGVLYTHFDALISPSKLAADFNKDAFASFQKDMECNVDSQANLQGCSWGNWNEIMKSRWRKASDTTDYIDPTTVFIGEDDIFYIPRKAFQMYSVMARGFAKAQVYHEVVGPTIRGMIARNLSIPIINMKCFGDCCHELTREDALDSRFRCGHRFDLREKTTQVAFIRVISNWTK
uniref:Hexosyltransferase n=1 Tax=Alexandrium catenella TaxID=2925 RepID=A0A7S1MT39_ALECA